MALADLIFRLEHDAQSRVREIEQETDAELRAIEASTDRAIAEITTGRLEHQRTDRRVVQERELAVARREAHARELAARHALLARILQRARALLPEIAASTSYREALPSHVDEALSFLEGLHARVRCQAAFASILAETIARHRDAVLVIDESVGPGVQAHAGDGSVTIDNTLASRLAREEGRLAIELSRELRDVQ